MIRSKSCLTHSRASSRPMPVDAPVTTASFRCVSSMGCLLAAYFARLLQAGLEYHLDATVLLLAEHLIEIRAVFERRHVRDDEGRINLSILDQLHELRQIVLHRRLRHPEGQPAVDRRAHRNL